MLRSHIIIGKKNIYNEINFNRSNANPQICYEDKRIQDIEARIEFLAREIQNYTPIRWKELVDRVILYFKDFPEEKHNPIPTPLDHFEVTYP